MKRAVRWIAILLVIAGLGALVAVLVLYTAFPRNIALEPIQVNLQDSTIYQRGKYLVLNVAACEDCHSPSDTTLFGVPPLKGKEFAGGRRYDHFYDFPGTTYTPNLTPTHLATWTDAELYRAITAGLAPGNRPLFPFMPYTHYQALTLQDAQAMLTYLRSLAPKPGSYPATEVDFPLSLIARTFPKAPQHTQPAQLTSKLEKGKYLFTLAACDECHTPRVKGELDETRALSGGTKFILPGGGFARSANITPHETGIGSWTEEAFVNRFKAYRSPTEPHAVTPEAYNSYMPWKSYSGMTDEDLSAIYTYLRTVKPIENQPKLFTPPAQASLK